MKFSTLRKWLVGVLACVMLTCCCAVLMSGITTAKNTKALTLTQEEAKTDVYAEKLRYGYDVTSGKQLYATDGLQINAPIFKELDEHVFIGIND